MKSLFIIPARGGSKGLPGKNIKPLNGTPLINYSLQYARLFSSDDNICVSTDSLEIGTTLEYSGYRIPFYRAASLSSDNASMYGVLLDALMFYEERQGPYDCIVLLQPTSPFRKEEFLRNAFSLFSMNVDMVVSVKESKANPYFNLYEEDLSGNLVLSKPCTSAVRRQDVPPVFQYNGSIYLINANSLKSCNSFSEFVSIKKFVIPDEYSIDIDTNIDFMLADILIKSQTVSIDGKR